MRGIRPAGTTDPQQRRFSATGGVAQIAIEQQAAMIKEMSTALDSLAGATGEVDAGKLAARMNTEMTQLIGRSNNAMNLLSRTSYDPDTMQAIGKALDEMPQPE